MNMTSESELIEKVKGIIEKRGRASVEKAREEILDSPYDGGIVSSAVKYFARVTLRQGLPVFPALISLSCEAVGGNTEKTITIGAAMELIAGAADVHDDIIDQSTIKYNKKTVLGKFGSDVALLAGDALLMQGLMLLSREFDSFSEEQRKAIRSVILQALFEISNAEANEIRLRKKLDTSPQEYYEVIRLKAVIPEAHCKIGGILGNANEQTINALGQYGRTFGVLSLIRDEFIDLLEHDELQNRIKNECPPLPMLYALQNSKTRCKIEPFIKGLNLAKKDENKLVKIVLDSVEVKNLKSKMTSMAQKAVERAPFKSDALVGTEASLLMWIVTEGI